MILSSNFQILLVFFVISCCRITIGLNRGALNTNVVGCNMNNETATFFYNVKIDRYNKLLQEKVGIEVEFTDHQNKVFPTYPNALISKEYDFDEFLDKFRFNEMLCADPAQSDSTSGCSGYNMVCVHITNRRNQDDNERMEFDASVLLVQCPNEYAYNVQPCLLNKIDVQKCSAGTHSIFLTKAKADHSSVLGYAFMFHH